MHYQDGTEVKLGDLARKTLTFGGIGQEIIGVVVSGSPRATTCNLNMQVLVVRDISDLGTSPWRTVNYDYPQSQNAGECVLVSRGVPEPVVEEIGAGG